MTLMQDAAVLEAFDALGKVKDLLGGAELLPYTLATELDVHDMLVEGLPGEALTHLVENLTTLRDRLSVEKAVGVSLRTLQRLRATEKTLSQEQSSRTWKFAEVLAKAIDVFGTQQAAEQWLERPAIGLNQCRPIDLLATIKGTEMVETFLNRIEYGVYT